MRKESRRFFAAGFLPSFTFFHKSACRRGIFELNTNKRATTSVVPGNGCPGPGGPREQTRVPEFQFLQQDFDSGRRRSVSFAPSPYWPVSGRHSCSCFMLSWYFASRL